MRLFSYVLEYTLCILLGAALHHALAQETESIKLLEEDLTLNECLDTGQHALDANYTAGCTMEPPDSFNQDVKAAAFSYGIDPWKLAVTVYTESGCYASAIGHSGELGLTQIHPYYWSDELKDTGVINDVGDLMNASTNLQASAYILSKLEKAYKDDELVFTRYNGMGFSARRYGKKQMKLYRKYREGN